jgi:hypothetical protein
VELHDAKAIRRDTRREKVGRICHTVPHQAGQALTQPTLTPTSTPRKPQRFSVQLDAIKPVIDAMLHEDLDAPRKQRHTARRVVARLADEYRFEVPYSEVRDYVAWRRPEIAVDAMLHEDLDAPRKQRHTTRRVVARLADEHQLEVPYAAVRDYIAQRRPEIIAEAAIRAANHTHRELELMLAGRKPLAFFYEEISCLPCERIIPEERFRPYVESGVFVRDEELYEGDYLPQLGRKAVTKYVFFAVKEEAWRIPAFRLSQRVFYRTGQHTEQIERIQSELLGYTAEEIDAWCKYSFGTNPGPRLIAKSVK